MMKEKQSNFLSISRTALSLHPIRTSSLYRVIAHGKFPLSLIHFPCIFSRDGEDKGRSENLFALWHQRICQEKFKDHRVILYKSLMNLVGYANHRFFLLFNAKPKRTLKTNSIYFRCFNRQPQKLLLSLSVGIEKSINFNFISQNATAGVNVERWISIGEVDFVCWSFLFSFNYTVESQTLT